MWKPDQNLDDYIVSPALEEPPRSVSLRRTGEVEVLKDLIAPEVAAKPARTAFKTFRRSDTEQPLWFRRFLAVGSLVLVVIAVVLLSAIFVGISDSDAGPEVAINETPDDTLTQAEEPFSSEISTPSTFGLATGEVDIVRSIAKRRPMRPSVHLAIYKPRPQLRPSPQPEQPKFAPTTLVIYAENGVIFSRIEPWFQTGDKKPSTFDN